MCKIRSRVIISSLIGAVKKVAIDEKVRDDIPEELVNRVILKEMKFIMWILMRKVKA